MKGASTLMSMGIAKRHAGEVSIIDLSGRITSGQESGRLRDAVLEEIASGSKKVLLNLGDVTYIDSSGLGELVSGFTSMSNAGGDLKLLNITKRVSDLLVITKLVTVFEVSDDELEAINSF
jgi:anti-sigma B factor antagonist